MLSSRLDDDDDDDDDFYSLITIKGTHTGQNRRYQFIVPDFKCQMD